MTGLGGFVVRRLLQALLTLWIVASLIFILLRAAPGDPTAFLIDPTFPLSVRDSLLESFGLDRSPWQQYLSYLGNLVTGDLGVSFFSREPVLSSLAPKLLNTLVLGLSACVIAYPLAILVGVFLASKRQTRADSIGLVITTFVRSAPEFWVAMIAATVFSFYLGWFPGSGMREVGQGESGVLETFFSLDFLYHLTLPALVTALMFTTLPLLITRNSMLDVLNDDYVELARAKGFSRRRVLYRHALRNALLPLTTEAAVSVGLMMGGLVVIEVVFSWPGLGREIVLAVTRKDYPIAQGAFLIMAATVVVMNMLADLVYGYLDPRISYQAQQH